ncbi:1-deoxy-D-xylulose-5-phosphate synthase [Phytoactinopolyspora halotolerans]|uniref:1-deoxy-D-xylulose-5-phosphate synthase n=1 Tax=Phytoactinopolyspora halotolerans TaxID=1981512 RepID=A0A6L9S8L3_9ACTN|nr:1-deoxy-D-xylulose-5-phosphate synthase [Phytoactinopolyspora halotolerans]NEE01407.1 1-deoxy-D-xylulose-5-phosphate synthase [Phytoactinopolyspora halotolerans]
MGVLERVREPRHLNGLSAEELDALAAEIRDVIVTTVSRTSGHLGPNLGVVELTLAVHRVFRSPRDPILFDVGHQSYVHKLLTGRYDGFDSIRSKGGISGYPSQDESPHDWIENSHASAALSHADGMAKAFAVRGERDRTVVAVVGDGALTGGMAWEALNNIAGGPQTGPDRRPLVIVVNDNGRSYSPTVGGLATHLAGLRTDPRYEQALDLVKRTLNRTPLVGPTTYEALHGLKKGLKDLLAPQGMFEDLGLKYIGPVDGHDRSAIEHALAQAKGFGGPVIVHCLTQKGYGYEAAVQDQVDHMHSPAAFDPVTGEPTAAPKRTLTHAFSDALVDAGRRRQDVVAITAAMLGPTGMEPFADEFPDRCFDVGIAEQHAAASAAGMAMTGLHPVVAIYSTFLNRAFDQVLMDCALHRAGVTFVLDRAGITGPDGPSHHGMWDTSILQVVPGLRMAAPRDADQLSEQFDEALEVHDAPTVIRFPGKEPADAAVKSIERIGGCDILARPGPDAAAAGDVLLVAVGAMAAAGVDAAERLQAQGVGVTVVDPRWIKPLDAALVDLARTHRLVVSAEDASRTGGVGSVLAQLLRDCGVDVPVHTFGIPARFIEHGKRAEILAELGLTGQGLAREVSGLVAALDSESGSGSEQADKPEPSAEHQHQKTV